MFYMETRKYVSVVREREIKNRVKNLEENWKFALDMPTERKYVSADVPLKTLTSKALEGNITEGSGKNMAWRNVLMPFHRIIMDWNLDVDEDVTIPQVLVAAKNKQTELLAELK